MNGRLIAIGDIHGATSNSPSCLPSSPSRATTASVLLGDLVNRGPDSCKVLDLARAYRATALLGNHELRLLKYRKTGDKKYIKEQDLDTFARLQPEDWGFSGENAAHLRGTGAQRRFVHGGFLPGEPWQRQSAEIVTRIQAIDRDGRPRKRADVPDAPSWADLWSGPPFVVYGHTPRPEAYRLKWSLGIDTGCVLGGNLTAYELPEKRFVQVKARQRYWS